MQILANLSDFATDLALQGLWMSVRHEVLYVVATRIKFMCPMNYATFPMDRQTCKFQVRKDITRYSVTLLSIFMHTVSYNRQGLPHLRLMIYANWALPAGANDCEYILLALNGDFFMERNVLNIANSRPQAHMLFRSTLRTPHNFGPCAYDICMQIEGKVEVQKL